MQIPRINILNKYFQLDNSINSTSPAFKSASKAISDVSGKFMYRIDTAFYRSDMPWDDFADFVSKQYKQAFKVNIVDHACSKGYEPYTLAMEFITKLGKKAKKMFPIKARDIDSKNIEDAKEGIFKIDYVENSAIKSYTNGNLSKFFQPHRDIYFKEFFTPQKILTKNVRFEQKNILEDMKMISKRNTVLLGRNFWPYLKVSEVSDLAEKLALNMKKSSLVVIGNFDKIYNIDNVLKLYGFKETPLEYVYAAPGKTLKMKKQIKSIKNMILKTLPDEQLLTCNKRELDKIFKTTINIPIN